MSKITHLKTANIFLRTLLVVELGFISASVVNIINYRNYWHQTIFRVQTVDFNMLSHMLPTKLSAALIKNDTKELQRTLDSNYGYFGLIVTNCKISEQICSSQKIIYASQSRNNYLETIQTANLAQQPFDLLRDPPPLLTEASYQHARAVDRDATGQVNPGNIIGRVYYLRGTPPNFLADYLSWIKNPLGGGGAQRAYTLTFVLFTVSFSLLWTAASFKGLKDQNKLIDNQNKRLEAENRLYRMRGFFRGFQEMIEQDGTSVIANHLEELRGILRRLDVDVDNIVHDMIKAPLLSVNSEESNQIAEKLDTYLTDLSSDEKGEIIQSVIAFLRKTDETISAISWVLQDLRQVGDLDSHRIHVQESIERFLTHLPPNLANNPWINITFEDKCQTPLWIMCNAWHLRSVAKNVIYNSAMALRHARSAWRRSNDAEFKGKIQITTFQRGDKAGITISDNGLGFAEEVLPVVYQTAERVHGQAEGAEGRGSIIVHSYLMLHEGEVEVSNRPEGGASVTFLFPLVDA